MDKQDVIEIDLRHALLMTARALDYVGVDDINHSHRVAYMAYECARKMGWPIEKTEWVYYTGLIHDCGVSTTDEHSRIISELQPENVRSHCIRGYQRLLECPILSQFAIPILYHHTQWTELKNVKISDDDRDITALIYLADRLDFLRAKYVEEHHSEIITLHKELIAESIKEQSDILFKPEYVQVMCDLIYTDGFWYKMEESYIELQAVSEKTAQNYRYNLSTNDVTQLAKFIAKIVDAKSNFTFQHSERVALLSQMLAEDCALSEPTQKLIYVAGLMHDVGKLRTPDEILNKGARLSREEYTRIRRHTVDTEHTLKSFFPNSEVGAWASNHHERLDGSGYPYNKTSDELDLPSRIIAIADVFQALSQERPYRKYRLSITEIIERLTLLAEEGKIDDKVFSMIKNNPDKYYQASIIEELPYG